MPPPDPPSLTDELAAALAWWREAGVDRAFGDESAPWLGAPPEAPPAEAAGAASQPDDPLSPPPAAPASRIGGDREGWPATLDAFVPWWLAEPTLDEGGIGPRVAPRGPADAELMIVVAMPETGDTDRLLSGEQGRLLAAMLQAMGLTEDRVYLAAALPRHTPLPDAALLRAEGMGAVLEHHVALAAPKRLLTFGGLVPPLLGHDMAQGAAAPPIFNHDRLKVPVMAAGGLDRLLRSAAAREAFWRRWLDWTDTKT